MRSFFAAFTLVACVLSIGCSTAPIAIASAAPAPADRVYLKSSDAPGAARVVIVRDAGFVGAGQRAHVYFNGARIASLEVGEVVELRVDAGEYVMGVRATLSTSTVPASTMTEQLASGRVYHYLISSAEFAMKMSRYFPDPPAQ